ncbi:mucoidy inhibitor MuiA family protein [uncultured Psychroserpens sp.]|uniref:mucoidy inhibitor MuiA family protein n=1 Tax=uncultured Psychroserpens sp. TaxID=255436 RepID=UPI002603A470|nr:mucoidy inhibitor MuiA family protein [uncultured Psychroserpens sp.]
MKQFTLLLFLITAISFANTKKGTPSKLEKVTVYLSGAQIERTANISLPIGTTEFIFDRLSPNIEESSIQISGLDNATILSINYGINYLSKQDRTEDVEAIQEQIKALYERIQIEDHTIAGYNEELYLITQNRALGNASEVVSLEKLQKFATYYRTRTTEIKSQIHASNKKKQDLNTQISDLRKQLNELNVDDKVQTGEIKIKLNSDVKTELKLQITYNVSNAGWFPIYDIKAEKINEPIQLIYKAHVYQNTGNSWDNIKLTLSTSDPNTNNVKPDVNPKYLNFISANSNYRSNRATKNYNYKYNPLVKTVSGVVTSSIDGLPLPGATVIEKGTTNGTQTDFDGKYSINTKGGKELTYTYVGMKTENLPIHSSIMNVAMDTDASALEEVVVVGYRGKNTAATKRVSAETIENRQNAGFVQTLSGQVPSLNITHNSGQPGANTYVQLRGVASADNNSQPLFIVDGVPVNAYKFRGLDPNEIATVNVIKDAEATSIYGNRAANGVVVIETKKGNYTSKGDIIEEGITNTRFEIKKLYTIPSDGDVTVIEIEDYEVPASYVYFAAPVLNENVFLTAKIDDWEQYNLLPAEANVYFEGSYSGKTNINPQSTTEELTISLGVDPNVVVKRTQPTDFKKNAFIGSNKIISKHYDIELKNNKSSAIDLVLYDRIPISQNKEIKIDDIETGNSEYDDKKGILKWTVNMPANNKETFSFSYIIKYPKYKRVNL